MLAILLIPLAHFSFANAANIFLIINAALWLCCTLFITNEVRLLFGSSLAFAQAPAARGWRGRAIRLYRDPAPLVALAVTCAIFFISRPALWTLGNGQINFLVLLPLAAIPWLTRHGHERWVGIAVALAIMLKLTPIVLLAYLILRRRWQAAATAVLTLLALAALCAFFIGPTVFAQFPAASLRIGSSDAFEAHNEALFAGFISVIVAAAPSLASVVRAAEYFLLAALASAGAVILWRAAPRASRVDHAGEMAAFSLALCGIVLLSPTAWAHHYVWLSPGSAIVLALTIRAIAAGRLGSAGSRQRLVLLVLSVVAAVFLNLPLPFGWDTNPAIHHTLFRLELRPWLQELRPLGGLLLACVAAWLALSMRRGGPDRDVAVS